MSDMRKKAEELYQLVSMCFDWVYEDAEGAMHSIEAALREARAEALEDAATLIGQQSKMLTAMFPDSQRRHEPLCRDLANAIRKLKDPAVVEPTRKDG